MNASGHGYAMHDKRIYQMTLLRLAFRRGHEKASPIGARVHLPSKENAWSRHQMFIRGKHRKKQKDDGLCILKMRVWELFTHGEGISTPCACHKGWQPLIECTRHNFMFMYFPFYVFFLSFLGFLCFLLFCGQQGCFPRSYVFLNCDKEIRPM